MRLAARTSGKMARPSSRAFSRSAFPAWYGKNCFRVRARIRICRPERRSRSTRRSRGRIHVDSHRGRLAQPRRSRRPGLAAGAVPIGRAGKLAARTVEQFKLRQSVFLAEIALDPFYAACQAAKALRKYRPISRFPAVERDFALVLDDGTSFAAVRDTIRGLQIAEIASIEAVDLYRGKQMPTREIFLAGARDLSKPGRPRSPKRRSMNFPTASSRHSPEL